ncbi:hypothetical protein ACIGW3_26185 [Streptomyces sp. NPDC053499]|uniref:hypothetical protein n=1 Tax=Streptomyces sp. NPDC053499 TaxID=3365707 RepID=UPI0037D52289
MTGQEDHTTPRHTECDDSRDGYVEDTSADGVVRLTWHPGSPPAAAQQGGDE